MRKAGVLCPIFSLPANYGIGTFGKSAYEFVDALQAAGQSFWQILPLGQTGYGDSPYQSFSTFAGNPYFIDLEMLIEEGLLTKEECDKADLFDRADWIEYEKLYYNRYPLLKKAYARFDETKEEKYAKFLKKNRFWLDDYALYMAVKDSFGGLPFTAWDRDIRLRKKKAVEKYKKDLEKEMKFYEFLQFEFDRQWKKLKKYANKKGVAIIGDIPIYVAFDSADTWSDPKLFQLDDNLVPLGVAGCPPDAFSATGQLWGNPLYDWKYHKKTGYAWWMKRMAFCFELYDVVRIDHFRGFESYYSIPYGDPTAEFGHWEQGPGLDLFICMKKKLGPQSVIAEDLGFLTDEVRNMVKKTGYPGMKITEFAFYGYEESEYLPHKYNKNCVVYTGTHDNETAAGWAKSLSKADREFAKEYLGIRRDMDIPDGLIAMSMMSIADTAIIPVQDYLGLGNEARINEPSTIGDDWRWRMTEGLSDECVAKIYALTKRSFRLPEKLFAKEVKAEAKKRKAADKATAKKTKKKAEKPEEKKVKKED
ncbi:MAG: 4-alpha-glucanotransferase [Lachnospiraceae bacterium]|nr:4-alpha-glucanotransferase [Lachnospiraceae bacterium]